MALITTAYRAYSNLRNVTITIGAVALPTSALKAIIQWIDDREAAIERGETLVDLVAGIVVVTDRHPFIVHRFIAVTTDSVLGTYAFTYDTSASNNESLP